MGPQYEWNHNPDTSRFSVNNGLRLQTATVTNDLYSARNTLTHRIQGPSSRLLRDQCEGHGVNDAGGCSLR